MYAVLRRNILLRKFSSEASKTTGMLDEEFRVLELFPRWRKQEERRSGRRFQDASLRPPREKIMKIDQDWPSVWPTAKVFRPSVVPLPVHQGYDAKRAPPGKYANAELMKIPNFLHLTPPAVKRHCAALKAFCTKWPKGLETDEDCDRHFPVTVITSDYCHSSPTIRDERSRIVTLCVKLSALNLDYHARDKLLRLVGPGRHDKVSDSLTLVADRCPLRKQNYDYLIYLLTAVHNESWIFQPWEHEKTEMDMEKFFFDGSRIEKHMIDTVTKIKGIDTSENTIEVDLKESQEVAYFGKNVANLINHGETEENVQNYKDSVLKALNLEKDKAILS